MGVDSGLDPPCGELALGCPQLLRLAERRVSPHSGSDDCLGSDGYAAEKCCARTRLKPALGGCGNTAPICPRFGLPIPSGGPGIKIIDEGDVVADETSSSSITPSQMNV